MMELKIFNTLTGRKEPFEPLAPGQVRMYVCGVTVYDECHLGHARSAIVFDVIRRYLEHRNFNVTFVKNFTDIDDKIINRARELGIPWQTVTDRYIRAYERDMHRLGVRKATEEPKATEHIHEIIELIKALIEKGVAYQVDHDVYFQIDRFPAYGRLSKRTVDAMQAGARVEVDERKRHPMDFVLWKGPKPGEPAWESPWGPGRPGWHIECSAMAMHHLGETLDIHGGGQDLIFPHHENEIAQSESATGKQLARFWVHNGFVTVDQEKMSKSLGNFFTIREIFEKFPEPGKVADERVTAEILRFFLLSTHYRSPLEFSDEALHAAWAGLNNFYDLLWRLEDAVKHKATGKADIAALLRELSAAFERAMDDDFNTPAALGVLQLFRRDLNTRLDQGLPASAAGRALDVLKSYGGIVGLFQVDPQKWEYGGRIIDRLQDVTEADIEESIKERNEARQRKDFTRADDIRAALADKGIILEDGPDGTTRWKKTR